VRYQKSLIDRRLPARLLVFDHGWRVIVLTSDDVYVRPEHTLARIQEALVTAGHPTVPADLHPAWRQHFTPRWVRDFDDQVPEVGHDGALR
jgi:hypothetical protein